MNLPTRKRSVVVVAGVPSVGKSTWCIRLLINGDFTARFVFDPQPGEFNADIGEFADRLKVEPTKTPFQICSHLLRQPHPGIKGSFVCLDPHEHFPNVKAGFDFLCEWAWQKSAELPGDKVIVVDDGYLFCTPHNIPEPMERICYSGSKRRLAFVINSQQPHLLNSTVKSCCSEIVCFRLQGEGSLKFAEQNGFNRDEVANLPPLHFVGRSMDTGGERRGKLKI